MVNQKIYALLVTGEIAYQQGQELVLKIVKVSSDRDSLLEECDQMNSQFEEMFSEKIEEEDEEDYCWEGYDLNSLPKAYVKELIVV